MSYDLMLYAANGETLAAEFRSGDALLERVLQRIRDAIRETGLKWMTKDLPLFEATLRAGLAGKWPVDGTIVPFMTLCWLLDVLAERIELTQFSDFKQWQTLEDTGLLKYFKASDSPIPLPKGNDTQGLATALINKKMPGVLRKELDAPDPADQSSRRLKTLLLDLIESLEPDGLDLFLIVN